MSCVQAVINQIANRSFVAISNCGFSGSGLIRYVQDFVRMLLNCSLMVTKSSLADATGYPSAEVGRQRHNPGYMQGCLFSLRIQMCALQVITWILYVTVPLGHSIYRVECHLIIEVELFSSGSNSHLMIHGFLSFSVLFFVLFLFWPLLLMQVLSFPAERVEIIETNGRIKDLNIDDKSPSMEWAVPEISW